MYTLRKKASAKSNVANIVQDAGYTDYVVDGTIVHASQIKPVLVSSASDLDLLTDYEPGTVATLPDLHPCGRKLLTEHGQRFKEVMTWIL